MKPVECEAAEDVGSRSRDIVLAAFPLFKYYSVVFKAQETPKLSFW